VKSIILCRAYICISFNGHILRALAAQFCSSICSKLSTNLNDIIFIGQFAYKKLKGLLEDQQNHTSCALVCLNKS